MKIFDILGFGSEISELLGELDFGLVELFESDFEGFHGIENDLQMNQNVQRE